MLNRNALRAEFVRNGMTQSEVAKAIGVSESTMTRKMNTGVFGTDEAQKMIDLLKISDPACVFFAREVTPNVTYAGGDDNDAHADD